MNARKLMRLARASLQHGGADIRLALDAIGQRGAMQRLWELTSLIALVRDIRPRTVVEIGTYRGGTLACWAGVALADAHLICLDTLDAAFGIVAGDGHARDLQRLIRRGQRLTFLPLDSQLETTAQAVRKALGGAAVDFLWIDGDHRDAGVRRDFALYRPLVRPGGLIAFHDIHPNPAFPDNQSHLLWRELRKMPGARAFIDQDHPGGVGMGIGTLTAG